MNKTYKILVFSTLLISVISLCILGYMLFKNDKVKYIDINYVYENFDAKKERQAELDFMIEKQETVLDSFELQLKGLYDQYELKKDKDLENKIILKEKNYQRIYDEFNKVSTEQRDRFVNEVMKQLNDGVKEFGKENKYKIILGANGSGSLMYADEAINISNEVLTYINKKYADE